MKKEKKRSTQIKTQEPERKEGDEQERGKYEEARALLLIGKEERDGDFVILFYLHW